jgi:ABC-type lipoprotein release transport system permease subunit
VLRALGAVGRQISATVMAHGATVAIAGTIVGVPLGIIAGRAVVRIVVDGIGAVYRPSVPVIAVCVTAAGVLVAVLALAAVPAWRAAHQRPGDALRAE